MKNQYNKTMLCCFAGSAIQALTVTFPPLLYVRFQNQYGLSLSQLTLLVTLTFLIQLAIDAASVKFIDRIGYRATVVLSNVFAAVGLVLMTVLPEITRVPYTGLVISVLTFSLGSGLLEVTVSPIVESCPSDNKEKAMSLLHSFYCWGFTSVVLLSTLFFTIFGIENWKTLTLIWAILPVIDGIAFLKVPIAPLLKEGETGMSLRELVGNRIFWLMMLAMLCSGASEQSVSQWASVLAERGLGVSKTMGDLMGPMFFAIMMGIARVFHGKLGEHFSLRRFMMGSCLLCIASYLVITLAPLPVLSLIGCGLCGLSCGIFWPGTLSLASSVLRRGGTALFSLLALAGDFGCCVGPTITGMVSNAANDNLKVGLIVAMIFPVALLVCIRAQMGLKRHK